MIPANSSSVRSTTPRHHPARWRAALSSLALDLRKLEEQLPLPADRRVRDTTPAQQKSAALRVDLDALDTQLLRFWDCVRALILVGR